LHLGTAFQLIDDALDYCSSAQEMGKNIGDDLAEGKPTLPLIHILQTGSIEQQQLVQNAITQSSRENLPEILLAIESTNAIEYTYQVAEQAIACALQGLKNIAFSPYREALLGLAQFALERRY